MRTGFEMSKVSSSHRRTTASSSTTTIGKKKVTRRRRMLTPRTSLLRVIATQASARRFRFFLETLPPVRTEHLPIHHSIADAIIKMDAISSPLIMNKVMLELSTLLSNPKDNDWLTSFSAGILVDSCLAAWRAQRDAYVHKHEPESSFRCSTDSNMSGICCHRTVKDMSMSIRTALTSPHIVAITSNDRDDFTELTAKILPRRCRAWNFQDPLKRLLAKYGSSDALYKMVLCSLLGNYVSCDPSSRPNVSQRHTLYVLFGNKQIQPITEDPACSTPEMRVVLVARSKKKSEEFTALIDRIPLLVVFAMRENQTNTIDTVNSMVYAANLRFNYAAFRYVVMRTMDKVRRRTNAELSRVGVLTSKQYQNDIVAIMEIGQWRISEIECRKTNPTFIDKLFSGRGAVPPNVKWAKNSKVDIRLPDRATGIHIYKEHVDAVTLRPTTDDDEGEYEEYEFHGDEEEAAAENEDDSKDPLCNNFKESVSLKSLARTALSIFRRKNTLPPECRVTPRTDAIVCSIFGFPWEHTENLQKIIHCINPRDHDNRVLERIIGVMPFFGISYHVMEYIYNMAVNHDSKPETKNRWARIMHDFRVICPYAYSYLIAAVTMWKEHAQIKSFSLSDQHRKNQLESIASWNYLKVDLDSPPDAGLMPISIPDYVVELWLCPVCKEIYSLVSRSETTKKQEYTCGFMDMRHDMVTDQVYCKKNKTSWNMACVNTPMGKLPILGSLIQVGKVMYALCPRCGQPMTFEPHRHADTGKGIVCAACTKRIDYEMETQVAAANQRHLGNTTARCILCPLSKKKKLRRSEGFYYGTNVMVCPRHNRQGLEDFVRKRLPSYTAEMIKKHDIDDYDQLDDAFKAECVKDVIMEYKVVMESVSSSPVHENNNKRKSKSSSPPNDLNIKRTKTQ